MVQIPIFIETLYLLLNFPDFFGAEKSLMLLTPLKPRFYKALCCFYTKKTKKTSVNNKVGMLFA
jgi:hypothetical protein